MRPDQFSQNPMSRFWSGKEDPWNPHRASSGDARQAPMIPEHATDTRGRLSIPGGPISSYTYRDTAYSERDSSVAGRSHHERAPSDSGYNSKSQAALSEQSADHIVSNQLYGPLDRDVNRMHLQPQNDPEYYLSETHGHQATLSVFEEIAPRIPVPASSVCRECGHMSKNHSDLKYYPILPM